MGVRDTQKQATRGRVLAAARDLFDAAGFEATTTRQIADRAGVAVGSVFTTFASKAEILSQVMSTGWRRSTPNSSASRRTCAARRSTGCAA